MRQGVSVRAWETLHWTPMLDLHKNTIGGGYKSSNVSAVMIEDRDK